MSHDNSGTIHVVSTKFMQWLIWKNQYFIQPYENDKLLNVQDLSLNCGWYSETLGLLARFCQSEHLDVAALWGIVWCCLLSRAHCSHKKSSQLGVQSWRYEQASLLMSRIHDLHEVVRSSACSIIRSQNSICTALFYTLFWSPLFHDVPPMHPYKEEGYCIRWWCRPESELLAREGGKLAVSVIPHIIDRDEKRLFRFDCDHFVHVVKLGILLSFYTFLWRFTLYCSQMKTGSGKVCISFWCDFDEWEIRGGNHSNLVILIPGEMKIWMVGQERSILKLSFYCDHCLTKSSCKLELLIFLSNKSCHQPILWTTATFHFHWYLSIYLEITREGQKGIFAVGLRSTCSVGVFSQNLQNLTKN